MNGILEFFLILLLIVVGGFFLIVSSAGTAAEGFSQFFDNEDYYIGSWVNQSGS